MQVVIISVSSAGRRRLEQRAAHGRQLLAASVSVSFRVENIATAEVAKAAETLKVFTADTSDYGFAKLLVKKNPNITATGSVAASEPVKSLDGVPSPCACMVHENATRHWAGNRSLIPKGNMTVGSLVVTQNSKLRSHMTV